MSTGSQSAELSPTEKLYARVRGLADVVVAVAKLAHEGGFGKVTVHVNAGKVSRYYVETSVVLGKDLD